MHICLYIQTLGAWGCVCIHTHTHTHTHGQHLKLTADVVFGFSINFQPLLSKKLLLLNWINITLSFIVNTPAGKSLPRAPMSAVFKLRCWLSWSGSPTSPVTARNRAPSSLDKTSKALQESIQRPDQTGAPCQLCAPSEGKNRLTHLWNNTHTWLFWHVWLLTRSYHWSSFSVFIHACVLLLCKTMSFCVHGAWTFLCL